MRCAGADPDTYIVTNLTSLGELMVPPIIHNTWKTQCPRLPPASLPVPAAAWSPPVCYCSSLWPFASPIGCLTIGRFYGMVARSTCGCKVSRACSIPLVFKVSKSLGGGGCERCCWVGQGACKERPCTQGLVMCPYQEPSRCCRAPTVHTKPRPQYDGFPCHDEETIVLALIYTLSTLSTPLKRKGFV